MFSYLRGASHRSKYYYERYPFNKHIVLLYDLIQANEMYCSDFVNMRKLSATRSGVGEKQGEK